MKTWKTLSKTIILDESPWLRVEHHAVELPDGRVIPNWQWVTTPDYVNVVVETDDGAFLCFRQGKYGLEDESLAIVGGYLQDGEDPLAAAKRELLEETGYAAKDWIGLGAYRVDPNRGIATGYFFLARGAHWVAPIDADDLEEQRLVPLSRADLEDALQREELQVMAWAAAVALALRRLDV